ncbi:MAG: DUF2062 domain-containing protein [Rhizobiaceae bacterium]
MLFSRRNPASWTETIRISLWPRRNWVRSGKYVAKRVFRLTASPHSIAAGVAAGVFASFTPYMGFHFIIAFGVAYVIGGNFIAAAMGTFFGNPISFPFIWTSTYATGKFILTGARHGAANAGGHHRIAEISDGSLFSHGLGGLLDKIAAIWEPVILPMSVGAVPLGVGVGILFYIATRWASIRIRTARQNKLELRMRQMEAQSRAYADTLGEPDSIELDGEEPGVEVKGNAA